VAPAAPLRAGPPPTPAPRPSWRVSLLLGGLALAAFAPALAGEPIGDTPQLLARVRFDSLSAWLHVFAESYWGGLAPGSGGYRPLALLWLGGQRALFGGHHGAMLAMGLALHGACVVLTHRLLGRVLPDRVATGAALVAAVHPIGAEAATTVYGQVDVLAALLVTAALWLHVEARERRGGARALLPGAVALAALLVKESAVVTPLLAWLVDARLGLRGEAAGGSRWRPGRGVLVLAGAVAAGVALRFVALGGEALPSTVAVSGAESPGARLQLVLVSFGTALRLLTVPWGQTIDYGHLRESVTGGAGLETAWVVGFVAFAGWLRGRGAGAAAEARFGVAWLAAALLPVISIVPIGFLAAERALYLPRVGWAVVVAALACEAAERRLPGPALRRRALVACTALAALLGVSLSWRVAREWRTPVSLWRHTTLAHPRAPKAHAAYALALVAEARAKRELAPTDPVLAEARRLALRCLGLNPRSVEGHRALAVVSELQGRPEEAHRLREEAARF
jgi:hypothetical protein